MLMVFSVKQQKSNKSIENKDNGCTNILKKKEFLFLISFISSSLIIVM